MIKYYSFFAKWRKKDVDFLNSLKLNRLIEEGYFGFGIDEGDVYEKILSHYSEKDSLFSKTKPPEFSITFGNVTFSKKELDESKYYELRFTGESKGDPKPDDYEAFEENTFSFKCKYCKNGKKQKTPFRIGKIKWIKDQVNFTLRDPDFMFFKKEFFQEVLEPLGLKSCDVIKDNNSKISDDVVQLIIPAAKEKLLIEGTIYDKEIPCPKCNVKQYSVQTLDFFPPFEKETDFLICKTQEEFLGGRRRIIITKEFSNLLQKHKIIKYNSNHLTPMKNI